MDITRRRALALCGAVGGGGLYWHLTSSSEAALGPASRPTTSDGDLAEFVRGNTEFGCTLLRDLAAEDPGENRLVSPVSVASALAMTWAGARGETETQMAETLRYALEQETLHPAVGALQYDLNDRAADAEPGLVDRLRGGSEFELTVANALWGLEEYPYRDEFLGTLETNYGAGLRTVDFLGDSEGAREEINDWVADATDDRIDELLPPGSITQYTRFVLTNAIALVADWDEPFDPDDTTDREFTALSGSSDRVPMMTQTEAFPYARVDGHQVVELPYVGEDVSMVVILPAEGEFESFERGLDADTLSGLFAALSESEVRLSLPRFEFDSELELSEVLAGLGMPDAFDREAANFDGIAPRSHDEVGNLYVFDVYHDAYVSVDEEGTEAVAATGVIGGDDSAPPAMTVDRPFLFCIRDRETDALLFLGRVVDAAAAQ